MLIQVRVLEIIALQPGIFQALGIRHGLTDNKQVRVNFCSI